jgi:hypothetical protein
MLPSSLAKDAPVLPQLFTTISICSANILGVDQRATDELLQMFIVTLNRFPLSGRQPEFSAQGTAGKAAHCKEFD